MGSRKLLMMIVIASVVMRLLAALYLGNEVMSQPGIDDQRSYDMLAQSLLAGQGFSFPRAWWPNTPAHEQTSFWSFLYTVYLAVIYAVFGHQPMVARLIQALLAGILTPYLTYRLGVRLFGNTVGLIAAILSAFYAYFVYYAGALMTETFYILAILLTLDLTTGMVRTRTIESMILSETETSKPGSARPWILLGVALGVATLLRQVILFFIPILFTWLLWSVTRTIGRDARRSLSRRGQQFAQNQGSARSNQELTVPRLRIVARGYLITVVVVAAMIAPWTIRNYLTFDRFVLLNTNAGFAFFWANHPIYGTNFVTPLPRNGPSYVDLIPPDLRDLNEAEMDQALLREGLRFVVEDPIRYLLLSVSRVWWFFRFWPIAASSPISNVGRYLSYGAFLPFMLYGLLLSSVHRRRLVVSGQQPAVVLLYLFMIFYTVIHLLSWALVRYRLPVDAVLLVFAALAIKDIMERLARVEALRSFAGNTIHDPLENLRRTDRNRAQS